MENEKQETLQPFNVIEKLREIAHPLGYDVCEFKVDGNNINMKLERVIIGDPSIAFGNR